MNRGTVVGEVWATRKCPGLEGRKLLLVATCQGDGEPSGQVVVAVDTMDARVGEVVLLSYGSGARNVIKPGPNNLEIVADAAVSEIVDGAS